MNINRFLIKCIWFASGLVFIYALFYLMYSRHLNRSFATENAIFIWGDSQAYQGLNTEVLKNELEKPVFTSAFHGAGVYDFLVFTQQVRENSDVLISISKLSLIRRKSKDFNQSGISFFALSKLFQENYPLSEIYSIIRLNIKPRSSLNKTATFYPVSDTVQINQQLPRFKNYFEQVPDFMMSKQLLFLAGVQNLIDKHCNIRIVDIPIESRLIDIELGSPVYHQFNWFNDELTKTIGHLRTDTIVLMENKNIFYDLTHLNEFGAQIISGKLANRIKSKDSPIRFVILPRRQAVENLAKLQPN